MWKRAQVLSRFIVLTSIPILVTGCPVIMPDPGIGTLMVSVVVQAEKAVGHRFAVTRPDPIGIPTTRRTEQLQQPGLPVGVLHPYMRVRVLDAQGNVLSTQFINDPLSRFVEVPEGPTGESGFWTDVGGATTNFLVAVPNFEDARTLEFTRFTVRDEEVDAGSIDLTDDPLGRSKKADRAAKGYDADDAEHATVVNNGPSANRLDLLILSDGFQDTNADRITFNQKVHEVLNYLWSIPIYNQIRSSINVHTAYLPSVDSGADHPAEGIDLDTPFETSFDCEGLDRLICITGAGVTLAYDVAADAPGNYGGGSGDAILILVNDTEYGGGGGTLGTLLTASINTGSPEIVSHEFGHTVMDLADEYEAEYNDPYVVSSRTKVNCSGAIANRADLKWIAMVDAATAIPTVPDDGSCTRTGSCSTSTLPPGTVGMYEGSGYTACGSFRPTTACQMRCYVGYFCPVCRGAYLDVMTPFPGPTVDVYMRDNSLDVGNPPSPTDVENPPGSGNRVKPYQSVDIRVDAPPLGDTTHENPVAGAINNVYVTVHNRGSSAAPVLTNVELYAAQATGGAPPFPSSHWTLIGTESDSVPGQEGDATLPFSWNAPPGTARHTCLLAIADAVGDPKPATGASLDSLVRNNNNVTWKNLHVVRLGLIQGDISNFQQSVVPIVLRIEASGVPVGTRFDFTHDGTLTFVEFEPADARQMDVGALNATSVAFTRTAAGQEWLALRTNLPAGSAQTPFKTNYTLRLTPPGGIPIGTVFTVTVDQIAVDPESGTLGSSISGNTYSVTLE